ncbi:MAG: hypothetical protein JO053_02610, partial [Acidobacteria bacterium]|nr:hypothetical protein [Acidobacteriota bacterium]
MKKIPPRVFVLSGFGVSLVSVAMNLIVLAAINDRIKKTDDELSKLSSSLSNQASEISWAKLDANIFTILNHIAFASKDPDAETAGYDSLASLRDYAARKYAAVHDISPSEMMEQQSEFQKFLIQNSRDLYDQADKKAREGKLAEADKIGKKADAISKFGITTLSETGQKLLQFQDRINPDELMGKDTIEIQKSIADLTDEMNGQFIDSYKSKQARIDELRNKKEDLTWWSSMVTYIAMALQIFGLMLILTRDLTNQAK